MCSNRWTNCFIDTLKCEVIKMEEKHLCLINCLGCNLRMTWKGWLHLGQDESQERNDESQERSTGCKVPSMQCCGPEPCSRLSTCCLKSSLCVGGGHTKTLAWFYGVVIFLGLLCVAAVPSMVFLRGAGPNRICQLHDRYYDDYDYDTGIEEMSMFKYIYTC